MMFKNSLGIMALAASIAMSAVADSTNVQILAAADTDYGIDAVATLVSEIQTAGQATFQISIDVISMPGSHIVSGDGGGETTSQSWGVGSDRYFKGADNEQVKSIGTIQVINFNANGGNLKVTDITNLSFTSVIIADAQSTHDRVAIAVNGLSLDPEGRKLRANPDVIDFDTHNGAVSDFSLSIGTSSKDPTKNKWSVNSIEVSYEIRPEPVPLGLISF